MNSKKNLLICIYSLFALNTAVVYAQNTKPEAIENAILKDKKNFYYIDFKSYNATDRSLPIGVFDSGTGGLTILNTLVQFDQHNNKTQSAGKDNHPDFAKEKFIYLADQANMPYGNYYSEKKNDLLIEHIIKDAQFLLSDKYYLNGEAKNYSSDKQKVKAIVIACNTATAYGKEYIEDFIKTTGLQLKVIGVIDAGAQGTLDVFKKDENGSIGVFATVGTIASKGYENTLLALKNKLGYTGNLQVYNQGGYGLAEAVDEEPDFINRKATAPTANYRGPKLDSGTYKIEKTLLDVYNFDFSNHKMLCDSKTDECGSMQLNAADNYARYHLVSLMEKIRKTKGAQPLKALVLGCTHYPFLITDIRKILEDLYNFQKNGEFIYRPFMNQNIQIIDPAVNVATELYTYLKQQNLFNPAGNMNASEFFISVPNTANKTVITDDQGRFTYGYKYGRNAGEIQEYVKIVPFSRKNIPAETLNRIQTVIPSTYQLIQKFHTSNSKLANLPAIEKIKP